MMQVSFGAKCRYPTSSDAGFFSCDIEYMIGFGRNSAGKGRNSAGKGRNSAGKGWNSAGNFVSHDVHEEKTANTSYEVV